MPLPFSVRRVTEVTAAELESAKAVCASAFKDDTFTSILTGGDSTLFGEFHGLSINAGLRGGQVYFAEKDNGEIIGVAIWFGPEEVHPLDSPDGPMVDLAPFLPKLRPEVQEWWVNVYLPDCERLLPEQLAAKKRLGAWHLHEIATAPEHQRKGVARALIDAVKEQAAENGRILTTHIITSELRIAIFKKLGFEVDEDTIAFHSVDRRRFELSAGTMSPAEPKGLD